MMMSSELPHGTIVSSAFFESQKVFALVVEDENSMARLFLRREAESVVEITLPTGLSFSAVVAARGVPRLLALVRGTPVKRKSEPLILDSNSLWVVDVESKSVAELKLGDEWSVMKLIAASEEVAEVISVVSTSRRTQTMVLVDYHLARISVQTGLLVVLQSNIGPRW